MKRTNQILKKGLFAALAMLLFAGTALDGFAQDQKKKEKVVIRSKTGSGEGSMEAIEVKIIDGKIFVDGKEVADVDTGERSFWVQTDDDGDKKVRVFGFKGEDGAGTYSVFDSEDEAFAKGSKGGHFFFKSDDGDEYLERMLEIEGLASTLEARQLKSRMAPMMERAMEFSRDGNAFAVMSGDAQRMRGDAETMKMDMRSRELAMKIRSSDGDTSGMQAELDQLLSDIFQKKQEAHQKQVDKLRSELQKLEQRLEERRQNQDDIISKRRKELLGERDNFDW